VRRRDEVRVQIGDAGCVVDRAVRRDGVGEGRWIPLLALALLLLLLLFPLLLVVLTSFKTEAEYATNGPFALPRGLNLDVLTSVWQSTDYPVKLANSALISVGTAVLATVLSLFNAFAIAIGKIRARTAFLSFFLRAITLPTEALIYPLYYFFKAIHLYDTQLSVILITATLHSAFGTYLMTTVLNSFPKELLEAARLDGATKMQLLWRIIVPVRTPSLSVLFVFFFIWTWNDFFLPLIFLISNTKQTVPLAVLSAQGEHGGVITTQAAASLLGILPCILFFIIFQRTLTRGVAVGGVK
jgi:raffinose/stachyose/melibiose transport system permease protein